MPPSHPRKVRSFVKRAGRITASQSRALVDHWPRYGLDTLETDAKLASIFGRTAPVVLEIGFGDGATLVEQAFTDPERDYLGIEVHEPGIGHCLLLAAERGTQNLRIINRDAVDVLQTWLPDESLAQINLYFPDPWPKKRHHKRRLIQPDFLSLAARKLCANGEFRIATDWGNYAEHIDDTLAENHRFAVAQRVEHQGDQPLDRPTTKFERRGLGKGHTIWDWRLTKVDADNSTS